MWYLTWQHCGFYIVILCFVTLGSQIKPVLSLAMVALWIFHEMEEHFIWYIVRNTCLIYSFCFIVSFCFCPNAYLFVPFTVSLSILFNLFTHFLCIFMSVYLFFCHSMHSMYLLFLCLFLLLFAVYRFFGYHFFLSFFFFLMCRHQCIASSSPTLHFIV